MSVRPAVLSILLLATIPAGAQTTVHVPVDHCDADKCYTPIDEARDTEPGGTKINEVFGPFLGMTFDPSRKGGVETEATGPEHHIQVIEADANSFKCEWYAKKVKGGVDGLAKGYCWIAIKK